MSAAVSTVEGEGSLCGGGGAIGGEVIKWRGRGPLLKGRGPLWRERSLCEGGEAH